MKRSASKKKKKRTQVQKKWWENVKNREQIKNTLENVRSVNPMWTKIGCACTAREDNTRCDDQYMDGVHDIFSILWLDTDGCHGDEL